MMMMMKEDEVEEVRKGLKLGQLPLKCKKYCVSSFLPPNFKRGWWKWEIISNIYSYGAIDYIEHSPLTYLEHRVDR